MGYPAEMFDYFGGIDFSGAREPLTNLWSALGCVREGKLHILDLRPHAFRADAVHFIVDGCRKPLGAQGQPRCLWGLDFPFSLPAQAAATLCGVTGQPTWNDVIAWMASHPPDDVRDAGRKFQKTTRQIDVGKAMAPLDLRIYKQTVEGVRFLAALRQEAHAAVWPQSPVDDASISLIEVYPSITATDLNMTGRRPRRAGQVRARPEQLAAYLTFDHPSMQAAAVTLEDAWDAVLACLTAYLVREDLKQPERLGRIPCEVYELEGWIYRHPDAAG